MISFEFGDRAVDRPEHFGETFGFPNHPTTLALQRFQPVEGRIVEDCPDLGERDAQLAMDQDLLKPHKLLAPVIAVAVLADVSGLEQIDIVIVMQRANRNARHVRNLFDCMHRLSHQLSAGHLDSPSRHVRVNTRRAE